MWHKNSQRKNNTKHIDEDEKEKRCASMRSYVLLRMSSKHYWIVFIQSNIGFVRHQQQRRHRQWQRQRQRQHFFTCCSIYMVMALYQYGCEGKRTVFQHKRRISGPKRRCRQNAIFLFLRSDSVPLNRKRRTMLLCFASTWATRTCFISLSTAQ